MCGLGAPYGRVHPHFVTLDRVHAKAVVLRERACFCLLSAFYNTPPPSKNPSKNLCLYWNPYKAPSKNPSEKHLLSVSSKRCSPPKVFRAFLTFWRNFDGFLTHFGRSSFPNKTRPILTHFWRIFDAFLKHFWRILAIADAFSENTFWTIPPTAKEPCKNPPKKRAVAWATWCAPYFI